jgi:hypothetical protein
MQSGSSEQLAPWAALPARKPPAARQTETNALCSWGRVGASGQSSFVPQIPLERAIQARPRSLSLRARARAVEFPCSCCLYRARRSCPNACPQTFEKKFKDKTQNNWCVRLSSSRAVHHQSGRLRRADRAAFVARAEKYALDATDAYAFRVRCHAHARVSPALSIHPASDVGRLRCRCDGAKRLSLPRRCAARPRPHPQRGPHAKLCRSGCPSSGCRRWWQTLSAPPCCRRLRRC